MKKLEALEISRWFLPCINWDKQNFIWFYSFGILYDLWIPVHGHAIGIYAAEVYLGSYQTSVIESFCEIVNGL